MKTCKPMIMLHGGAGDWSKASNDRLIVAKKCIKQAVETGYNELLKNGALQGVLSAIKIMEDCGAFNAGIGSVPNAKGIIEMDAGIMDGYKGDAGAVAALRGYRNPVLIAYKVLTESPHVILAGDGASDFALKNGFKKDNDLLKPKKIVGSTLSSRDRWISDTVGAVAIDSDCRTAAGSSTGGVKGKLPGRIGDSPIPGAGFYANHFAAATATGVGEVMILTNASRWIVDNASRLGSAVFAGKEVLEYVNKRYKRDTIGVITVDVKGGYARFFNTKYLPIALMYKGLRSPRIIGFP